MFLTYYLKQVLIFMQDCVQIEVERVYATDYSIYIDMYCKIPFY